MWAKANTFVGYKCPMGCQAGTPDLCGNSPLTSFASVAGHFHSLGGLRFLTDKVSCLSTISVCLPCPKEVRIVPRALRKVRCVTEHRGAPVVCWGSTGQIGRFFKERVLLTKASTKIKSPL